MEALYIVCVLYNRMLDEIRSWDEFLSFRLRSSDPEVQILVMDNSSDDIREQNRRQWEKRYCDQIIFMDDGGNLGLSRAYNLALSRIGKEDCWVMLADDDTFFSQEYLDQIAAAVREGKEQILSGIIRSEQSILSPLSRIRLKPRKKDFIAFPGIYHDIFCINSGLTIKKQLLDDLGGFDERLFLDMIDYWLIESLKKRGIDRIRILDGTITQRFSGNGSAEKEALLKRYAIYRKDFAVYCSITGKNKIYRLATLAKRRLGIELQQKKWHRGT